MWMYDYEQDRDWPWVWHYIVCPDASEPFRGIRSFNVRARNEASAERKAHLIMSKMVRAEVPSYDPF